MRLGCVLVILLLWAYSSHGWAPLYHSPTPHEYSGIYSVVLKKSAPPTSREYLIRSIRGISQDNEFKLIAKSHKTHLGFTARLPQNILSLVRTLTHLFKYFFTLNYVGYKEQLGILCTRRLRNFFRSKFYRLLH